MTAVGHHYILSAGYAVSVPSDAVVIGISLIIVIVGSISVFTPVFVVIVVSAVNLVFILLKN